MIWDSMQAVIVIFGLIGAGMLAAWRKWITPDIANAFPKLLVNLAVPCMAVYHFYTGLDRQQVLDAWLPLLVLLLVFPVSYFAGRLFAVIFNIPKTRRGVFTVLFSFSNSMFIGFPVAQALFGDAGLPFAMYYYLGNTTFFWVLGYYAIRSDADVISGSRSRLAAGEVVRKLATPPIITIIVMLAIVMLQIPLPGFVVDTARYLGALTTPLSLIFMGCVIWESGLKGLGFEANIAHVLTGRFLLIPALMFFACQLAVRLLAPAGTAADLLMMRNVFTVQAGLPVMTQTVIISQLHGADVKFATKSFIWTTMASVVFIPVYMVLFQNA